MPIDIIPFPIGDDAGTPGGGGSGGFLGGSSLAGELFMIPAEANLATSGNNNPMLLVRNPAGSSKRMFIQWGAYSAINHNYRIIFRVFHTPTISATGAASAAVPMRIGSPPPTSALQLYKSPTITASGTQISVYEIGKEGSTIIVPHYFGLVLLPGSDLLFTGDPESNNRGAGLTLTWGEVSI